MNKERFEELIEEAVSDLPEEFRDRLENVDIVVEGWPTKGHLDRAKVERGHTLLGLYQGVPMIGRGRGYGLVPPDKITIFQGPIEVRCRNDDEIRDTIKRVVRHEIAHHFGTDDARLAELERGQDL
jgi:predicted Zn-dependent protease with MMP-like domain